MDERFTRDICPEWAFFGAGRMEGPERGGEHFNDVAERTLFRQGGHVGTEMAAMSSASAPSTWSNATTWGTGSLPLSQRSPAHSRASRSPILRNQRASVAVISNTVLLSPLRARLTEGS
jgi:hypothetical protein